MTGPAATPTQVGLLYKILGVVALVGLVVLDIIAVAKGQLGVAILGINAIMLLTILALIRPQFFNDAMKVIAAKLPI